MAHDVVHRDASGESDSSLEVLALLGSESFLHFFLNHSIDSAANSSDIGAWNGKFGGLGEALYKSSSGRISAGL